MDVQWRAAPLEQSHVEARPEPGFWSPVSVPGRPAGFADAEAVAYRTTFPDPREDADEAVFLSLHGGPGPVTIWCNEKRLTRFRWPHRRRIFELPSLEAENEVVIVCERPTDRFRGAFALESLAPDRGIPAPWWELGLTHATGPHLLALDCHPKVTANTGRVDLEALIWRPEETTASVTISGRPAGGRGAGTMERATVPSSSTGGSTTVSASLAFDEPTKWSPRPDPSPARYVIRAKLGDSARSQTVGFRTLSLADGTLSVNGDPVPLRGAWVLPGDPIDTMVERALEANMTALRVYGHVAPPALYAACAEAGLLIWQDLPLSGPGEVPVEPATAMANSVADAISGRPAVGLVSVHDEPVEVVNDPLGDGLLDRLRLRWRAFRATYDSDRLAPIMAEFEEHCPTIPAVGGPGVGTDAGSRYPGVYYGEQATPEAILDRYPVEMLAATGAPAAAPDAETLPAAWQRVFERAAVESASASRAYQRRLVRRTLEVARRRGITTTFVRSLVDEASTGGFGLRGTDDTAKPAWEAIRHAFEPVQTVLTDPSVGAESSVVGLNDTGESVDVRVTVALEPESRTFEAGIPPQSSTELGTVSIPTGVDAVELNTEVASDEVRNRYRFAGGEGGDPEASN